MDTQNTFIKPLAEMNAFELRALFIAERGNLATYGRLKEIGMAYTDRMEVVHKRLSKKPFRRPAIGYLIRAL